MSELQIKPQEPRTQLCPRPTPELVAALANAYIEECAKDEGGSANMDRAFESVVGSMDPWAGRGAVLCHAALSLARAVDFAMPYSTQVTMGNGTKMHAERHTITYFADGEGFTLDDVVAIHSLDPGDSYLVAGEIAVMAVTRVE